MFERSDWSQFIPNLIGGLLLLVIGGVAAYFKSDRFKKWFNRLFKTTKRVLKWLIAKWHFVLLHSLIAIGGIVVFHIYGDWRILVFSLACYVAGLLSWRLSTSHSAPFSRSKSIESKTEYLPISLASGIGNSYLKNRYVDPPSGDIFLGGAQFRLEPNALMFDTNERIGYVPRGYGRKEIDPLKLLEPRNHVKSVHFLINSSNSKAVYKHQGVGEIKLVFRDAPPIVVELVLGRNIREWCPGNSGDFVREAYNPMLTMNVWKGLGENGANAVIDCLQIPVYECMRNCFLEKIIFVHKSLQHPSDTMGVHFFVFAVSLETEWHIE